MNNAKVPACCWILAIAVQKIFLIEEQIQEGERAFLWDRNILITFRMFSWLSFEIDWLQIYILKMCQVKHNASPEKNNRRWLKNTRELGLRSSGISETDIEMHHFEGVSTIFEVDEEGIETILRLRVLILLSYS